ncbi:MAG TPA: FoF1 ATP synthase subunit a [Candidatus Dormibacteraeota bacterium]
MTAAPLLNETPGTHPAIDICGAPPQVPGLMDFCHLNLDTVISSGVAIFLTLAIAFLVRQRLSSAGPPGRLQLAFELAINYVRQQVHELAAEDAAFVVPLAMTIALYILIANYLEFFPLGIFPNLVPANADWNQTLAMALVVFFWTQGYSIKVLGLGGFLRKFTKPFDGALWMRILFIPLNIIEEVAKPLSLSLRLFGNIFAGVVMVFLIVLLLGQCSALPVVGPIAIAPATLAVWKGFDVLFIGAIQAFIFMLLTIVYFGQAREGLDEHH